jgi:hypothetical protein
LATRARFAREIPKPKSQAPKFRVPLLGLGVWNLGFPPPGGLARALLKEDHMLNPAVIESTKAKSHATNFWLRILTDEELSACDDLQKLIVGCEIIAALDAVDLLAA